MDYLRIFALPCLLLCVLFSNAAHAEKFVAKAKFTLVDPVSVSTVNKSDTILIPLKKNRVGTCNINPEDGNLSGQVCNDTISNSAEIELGGNKYQAVTVNLDKVNSSESLSFTPKLFNGQNSDANFQLDKASHSIYVGGQVSMSNSQTATHANQLYNVEVLYP